MKKIIKISKEKWEKAGKSKGWLKLNSKDILLKHSPFIQTKQTKIKKCSNLIKLFQTNPTEIDTKISIEQLTPFINVSGYETDFILMDMGHNPISKAEATRIISESLIKLFKYKKDNNAIQNIIAHLKAGRPVTLTVSAIQEKNKIYLIPFFQGTSLPSVQREFTGIIKNQTGSQHSLGPITILPIRRPTRL